MKRLHKKIGVGVLVAGLLMGGAGGLGGSVAHANSKKVSKEQSVSDKMEKLGNENGFHAEPLGESRVIVAENQLFPGKFIFDSYEQFRLNIGPLQSISRGVGKRFIKVQVGDKEFIIVFWKK